MQLFLFKASKVRLGNKMLCFIVSHKLITSVYSVSQLVN